MKNEQFTPKEYVVKRESEIPTPEWLEEYLKRYDDAIRKGDTRKFDEFFFDEEIMRVGRELANKIDSKILNDLNKGENK